MTTGYSLQEAAERAGVDSAYVTRLQELGIFPAGTDAFSEGDVRRVLLARSLEGAGIPLDAVGDAVQRGAVRMDFLDASAYDRFAALCGKTIKWLGDGVMFYFADPAPGVRSALEMAASLPAAGLPQVHVGLHAGPVLFQEGDYFGATVNLSARIADDARPGEVLVTQPVADASADVGIGFSDIGQVELKGVAGSVQLLRAHLD